jgi:acetyltransferase-like isoleucine patch superfamily enzyme
MQLSRLGAFYLRLRYRRHSFGAGFVAPLRLRIRGPGQVVVGSNVRILNRSGRTALLTFNREARIEIGDQVEIDGAGIMAASRIMVDAEATLGPCLIVDTDFHAIRPEGRQMGEAGARRPIRVGRQAVIEGKATVLKGVSIGEGAVVRWGSVVASDVEAWTMVLGNPASVVAEGDVRR